MAFKVYRHRAEQVGAAVSHQRSVDRPVDQSGNRLAPQRGADAADAVGTVLGPQRSHARAVSGIGERAIGGDQRADRFAVLKRLQPRFERG